MDVVNLLVGISSLAISVWALLKARNAANAIQEFRRKQRVVYVTMALVKALHLAREIQDSAAVRWPRRRCDELREAIAQLGHDPLLTAVEREAINSAVVEFRSPRENDEEGRAQIREFVDELLTMQRRLVDLVEESLS